MTATTKKFKQLKLDNSLFKEPPKEFGGSLVGSSHAKIARPITTKNAIHVVLRSSIAIYNWSFVSYKNKRNIENIIQKQARTLGIKIY